MSDKRTTQCESCAYYDYDDESDAYVCSINLDEDDVYSFYESRNACPYYRFYDEYKLVHKQN